MNKLKPVSRKKLIQILRKLGFDGPFSGGKHMYMSKGDIDLRIPNPHQKDISPDLISRLLRQSGVNRSQWMKYQ